jgi:hypothetical protein
MGTRRNRMKFPLIAIGLLLAGCQHVTINYKSNVNATDSQINQSTEVSPDVQ